MAPRADKFEASYETQSKENGTDIDSMVDDSLRSFMDMGDDIFANETVGDQGLKRQDIIRGVRENILRRLKEENNSSVEEARQMRDEHNAYSESMMSDFDSIRAAGNDMTSLRNELEALEERENNDTSSSFIKFFKFRGIRKANYRRKINALITKREDYARKIRNKTEKWSEIRNKYAADKVRKHYKTYDALAKSWYELTHESAVSELGDNADPDLVELTKRERAIPDEYEKNIMEYTGVYAPDEMETLITGVMQVPDYQVSAANLPKRPYKYSRNAGTGEDYLTKTHKKILLLSETDVNTGIQTRFKFDSKFLGTKAKRQFTAADTEETALEDTVSLPPNRSRIYAEEANLESDRRDINGRFLFSEKNAEILHARLKKNGQTVYGFYQNGEFLTNEEVDDAVGEKVARKEDMKFFGRRNWDKQEKAEKLRVAIRTSPFFKHVNARTIQFYAGYDAEGDYGESIGKELKKRWDKSGTTKEDAVDLLKEDPEKLDEIPEAVRAAALAEYIKVAIDEDTDDEENAFSENDVDSDPVLRRAIQNNKNILQLTCLLLLSDEEDARLWTLARNIILKVPKIVQARTIMKMKYIPENGMMMRMTLLDELYKFKGNSDFTDEDEDEDFDLIDEMGVGFEKRKVLQEELDSKRGAGNWIKRNLLNGNIIKEGLNLASTGMIFAENVSSTMDFVKNDGYKNETDEERQERIEAEAEKKESSEERAFWFSYGECLAESNEVVSILAGAGTLGAFLGGGSEVAGIARDIGFQVFDVLDMINQFMYIVKAIKKFFKKKTAEEKEKEARGLQDLDAKNARKFLNFLEAVVNFLNSGRDLASYHVAEESTWGAVVNKTWGSLLAFKGPLDFAFSTTLNTIAIIKDIIEIVVSTKRIGRIEEADADLETAISQFKEDEENRILQQIMQPEEVREDQEEDKEEEDKEEEDKEEEEEKEENLSPEEKERKKRTELGKAASENAQAQYFMSLTKMQSRKKRSGAAWDIAAKTLSIGKDTLTMMVDPSGSIFGRVVKTVLSIAPKIVEFVGWTIGKLKYDRNNFKDNIASMLGDKSYAGTPYFDKVLKRETGIVSSSYLSDIAKIFMSIDTHALINKEDASGGEKELGKKVVATLYGGVNDENYQDIKLSDMMKYAGLNEDTDWRTLLRSAIKG